MKVLHKPTGEVRMIKAFRFNPDLHKRIELYRDPNGDSQVTTIYTSDGRTMQVEKKIILPKNETPTETTPPAQDVVADEKTETPTEADRLRWEELQKKRYFFLKKSEREEYKRLKKLFTLKSTV